MERLTNCPNCGAPYDGDMHKCPYCGTICVDMTYINFDDPAPVFLKFKCKDVYFTQRAIPRLTSMNVEYEDLTIHSGIGNVALFNAVKSCSVSTNITFDAIANQNELFTMRKAD